jgi:Sua5/YciO/YrdC/YwlC family protein
MTIEKKVSDSAFLAASVLRENKVVILPTDTIYGFSGIVPDSLPSLIRIKGRDEGKPFIQLISDPDDLKRYTTDAIHPALLALWPGAITIIVRNRDGGTTAFRCPGDAWLRQVIRATGSPVYSTSVNLAGEPALKTISEILETFGDKADLIVCDGNQGSGTASTIVDATREPYRIVRQGALTVPDVCLR